MRRAESDDSSDEETKKPRYKITAPTMDSTSEPKAKSEEVKKKAKDAMLPDQGAASAAELKRELGKAAANPQLMVSILGTLIRKLPEGEKVEYTLQRARLCLDLQRNDEAIRDLNTVAAASPLARVLTAKAFLQKDDCLAAAIEYFRARALLQASGPEAEDVGKLVARGMQKLTYSPCFYIAGSNVNCTLGDGTDLAATKPKALAELKGRVVCGVACGSFHTIVLVSGCTHAGLPGGCSEGGVRECNGGNDVFGWGANRSGQVLGFQTAEPISKPTVIGLLIGRKAHAISAAAELSCALLASGEVAVWGYSPRLGDTHFLILQERVTGAIAAGQDFILASKGNTLCFWGSLHSGDNVLLESPADGAMTHFEVRGEITSIAAGTAHALIQTFEGDVYVLGSGQTGQLGLGRDTLSVTTPTKVPVRDTIVSLSCGPQLSLALSQDTAFIWGQTDRNSHLETDWTPSYVTLQSDSPLEEVAIGAHELLARDQSGHVFIRELAYAKRIRDPNPHFSSLLDVRKLASGKSMHCVVTSVFLPELCKVAECPEEAVSKEPFMMTIELRDQFGLVSPANTHMHFVYKQEETESDRRIPYNTISDIPFSSEYKAVPQTKTVVIAMTPLGYGQLCLHVYINEGEVMNSPVRIVVRPSPEEMQQAQEEEELRRAEMEARARSQNSARKTEEEKAEAKRLAEEEASKRRSETSKRAQDALKSQRERDAQEKKRQEEERKARLDIKTGGGFDLDKAKSADRRKRK